MTKVGFAKIDLEDALRPVLPVREERIEAIAFYVSDEKSESLWITLDFMDFNLEIVNLIKNEIHSKTNISPSHIHILTTHNHGGGTPDTKILASLCTQCSYKAAANAVPSMIRYGIMKCNKQVSIKRRVYIPELNGSTTVWFGASDEDNFNTAPFVENAVESVKEGHLEYCGKRDTTRDFVPFYEGDPEVFTIEFRDMNANTIGTIVRFSAHAVCCNREGSYSSDYPYHVRHTIEENTGGICVFLNGPCAEIAPAMKDKYDGTQVILGKYIAEVAMRAVKESHFEEIRNFKDKSVQISLPVRKEIINNEANLCKEIPVELSEKHQYLEYERFIETMPFLNEKYSKCEASSGNTIDISLGMLQFNDLNIIAFPGETFNETAEKIRKEFSNTSICSVTEHGRTVMYIPPEKECILGGYESVCRLVDIKAENVLRHETIKEFNAFIKGKNI